MSHLIHCSYQTFFACTNRRTKHKNAAVVTASRMSLATLGGCCCKICCFEEFVPNFQRLRNNTSRTRRHVVELFVDWRLSNMMNMCIAFLPALIISLLEDDDRGDLQPQVARANQHICLCEVCGIPIAMREILVQRFPVLISAAIQSTVTYVTDSP